MILSPTATVTVTASILKLKLRLKLKLQQKVTLVELYQGDPGVSQGGPV